MRLGYNSLAEAVLAGEDGVRSVSGLRPGDTAPPSRLLSFSESADDGERFQSIWSCACAFVSQPKTAAPPFGRFFNICAQKLPASRKPEFLAEFSIAAITAFFLLHDEALARGSLKDLRNAFDAFEQLGLPRAAAHLGEATAWTCLPTIYPILRAEFLAGRAAAVHGASIQASLSLRRWGLPDAPTRIVSTAEIPVGAESVFGIPFPKTLEELVDANPSRSSLGDRIEYEPFSSLPSASAIAFEMREPQRRLRAAIACDGDAWDERVATGLGMDLKAMRSVLSAEQIDACGLALESFSKRPGFIIADETGLGKGRALAAMALSFMRAGRPVIFVTEKRTLFSDFWRDIQAVNFDSHPVDPFILHPKGKIYSQDGQLVKKAPGPKAYAALLGERSRQGLIFTCYSQFNREMKGQPRWDFLAAQLSGALLILDESHNAAGDSRTRANVSVLIEKTARCIFSSATFAKHEDALELYAKALPLSKKELALLLQNLSSERGHALAKAMASGLVEAGCLVRREHLPEGSSETLLLELPDAYAERAARWRESLSSFLEAMYRLGSYSSIVGLPQEKADSLWNQLGGYLSRLSKQLDLLSKIDYAVELAKTAIQEGAKPIFALESTFESFVKAASQRKLELSEADEDSDEDAPTSAGFPEADFGFSKLAALAVETLAPEATVVASRNPDWAGAKAWALSLASELPQIVASPIDLLISALSSAGISCSEISGRGTRVVWMGPGVVQLAAPDHRSKEELVRMFNFGETDALVITKAGSTGISLHSSPLFSDTRPRRFFELEIAANPAQRLQFLGRVRRKGQLCPPQYATISSGSPFERRWIERSRHKQAKLSALAASGGASAAGSIEVEDALFSRTGERLAAEWLAVNSESAKRMGLSFWRSIDSQDDESVVERLLRRLPLLPVLEQTETLDLLTTGCSLDREWQRREVDGISKLSAALPVRRSLVWGPFEAIQDSGPFVPQVFATEWIVPAYGKGLEHAEALALLASGEAAFRVSFPRGVAERLSLSAANASRIVHPMGISSWNNLRAAAAHLRPGARLRLTEPATGRPILAIVSRVEPPANPEWMLYPSMWALEILIPGDATPSIISLGTFFADPAAYLDAGAFPEPKVWAGAASKPLAFLSLDGHCVYQRWWGRRTGKGYSAKFNAAGFGARQSLLIFGERGGVDAVDRWPIPLLDPLMVVELLRRDSVLVLDGRGPGGDLCLAPCSGGWNLKMDEAVHEKLVDYPLDRKLGPRRYSYEEGRRIVHRFVSQKALRAVLSSLHLRGTTFFAPHTRRNWHRSILQQTIGQNTVAK